MKTIATQAHEILTAIKLGSHATSQQYEVVWGAIDGKYCLSWEGKELTNAEAKKKVIQGLKVEFSNMLDINFLDDLTVEAFDKIEVWPVADLGDGQCETCEPEHADFYSVYVHLVEGGIQCIADLPTKKLADSLANLIEKLISVKP